MFLVRLLRVTHVRPWATSRYNIAHLREEIPQNVRLIEQRSVQRHGGNEGDLRPNCMRQLSVQFQQLVAVLSLEALLDMGQVVAVYVVFVKALGCGWKGKKSKIGLFLQPIVVCNFLIAVTDVCSTVYDYYQNQINTAIKLDY